MSRIFVGSISYDMTERELRELFSPYGAILEAKVVTDRETGRPRGFAFVEMDSDSAARTAIAELDGSRVMGRDIVVNEAKPREAGRSRSNGGGGGRDRGGYDGAVEGDRGRGRGRGDRARR